MNTSSIETSIESNVLVCCLNRPESHNSLSDDMLERLIAMWDEADEDDSIRAVVLTGTGRSFSSGADLSAGRIGGDASATRDRIGRLTLRISQSLKPSIAAINGHAVGSGLTLTLPMDFRLVSESAKLGFVFTQRGISPEGCSTWFLPRIVGMPTAVDWMCSGRVFTADEALAQGLVRSVHGQDEVLSAAVDLAQSLTEKSAPIASAATLALLRSAEGEPSPHDAHARESAMLNWLKHSPDSAEGVQAFLERRPASFEQGMQAALPAIRDHIRSSDGTGEGS